LPVLKVCLWLLLALGIACRFVGLNWDEGAHLHPDERFLTMTVPQMSWPQSWGEYFETARAPLNPTNIQGVGLFVYGQFPLLVAKAVAGRLGGDNYDGILVIGRALSAIFDTGSVLLLLLIGRRIGGPTSGLLAASLLACTALHIQHAHFFVVDGFAVFFLLASFHAGLRWLDEARIKAAPDESAATPPLPASKAKNTSAKLSGGAPSNVRSFHFPFAPILMGLWWGMAMACKISSVLFAVIVLAFCAARWFGLCATSSRSLVAGLDGPAGATSDRAIPIGTVLLAALLIFASAFYAFRIFHPIAFQGEAMPMTLGGILDVRPAEKFWSAVRDQSAISMGETDLPWNLQWIGRRDYIFPLHNLLSWSLGWPLGLAGIAGIGAVLIRFLRRQTAPIGLVLGAAWVLLVFFYYAHWYSKFTRYYLVMTPFVALAAAWLLVEWWRRAHATRWRWAAGLTSGIVVGGTALWALAVTSIYTRTHTRIAASRWIVANLPPGTVVANETAWDDALPWGVRANLVGIDLALYDPDTESKRQSLLDKLGRAEWIFISSNRVWGSVPRLPQRWPLTTEYYRALFDGRLGFVPTQEFTSYPQLNLLGMQIQFPDDTAEEALTVYDHPRVVLFQKSPTWSRQKAEQILNPALLSQATTATLAEIRSSGWRPDERSLPWLPSPAR